MIGKEGYFWDKDGVKTKGTLTAIRDGNFYKYVDEEGTGYMKFQEMKDEAELVGKLGWFWNDQEDIYREWLIYGRLESISNDEFRAKGLRWYRFQNFSTENPLKNE